MSKSKPISRFALRAMVICKNKQDVGFGKGGPNFSPFCSKMNRFRDIKQNVLCAKRERQNKEGNITCFFLQTSCAKRESRNPESNFPFPFARNAKREMLNPTFLSPLRETRSAKQKRGKTGQNCDWTKKTGQNRNLTKKLDIFVEGKTESVKSNTGQNCHLTKKLDIFVVTLLLSFSTHQLKMKEIHVLCMTACPFHVRLQPWSHSFRSICSACYFSKS